MAPFTDYICPMVYPSHFESGDLGFENPDVHPYEMILESLKRGQPKIQGKGAIFRPWLQAFDATWLKTFAHYDRAMIRRQIQAVAAFGQASGWNLWNPENKYDLDWFDSR